MPIAWKNSRTSTGVGAAPTLTAMRASKPSWARSGAKIAASACAQACSSSSGTGSPACCRRTWRVAAPIARSLASRCSSGSAATIASRPALSFSQMRGTAKNQDGRTAGSTAMIWRGSGQVVTVRP